MSYPLSSARRNAEKVADNIYGFHLKPEVLDAAFMAAKGAFASKSAEFIGKMFFGFDAPKGYSITNLGRIENANLSGAFFIPPASPAIRKTVGVLTVNGEMRTCTCDRR